ncbi:MAG: hypothetical protein C4330_09515 [Chitinophagaceae bacterium]
MKSKVFEACFTFLALFLFACGFAATVFIGMMLMPIAFMAVFVLAIREIIIWKRRIKPVKPLVLKAGQRHDQENDILA